MLRPFGDEMRQQRVRAGKTMQDVAREIGVSIAYVSDVERGHRAPLNREQILKAATVLGVPPEPLLLAAAQYRGGFELPFSLGNARRNQLGVVLMRRWESLGPAGIEDLLRVILPLEEQREELEKFPGL